MVNPIRPSSTTIGDYGYGAEVMVIQAVADAKVLVPDGGWILGAQFSRQGQDLLLIGQ